MSSEPDPNDRADQTSALAYDKCAHRDTGNPLRDWRDAEEEFERLQILTQRVAELEAQAQLAQETDLSRQLAETESRLRSLVAERKQANCRLVAEHAVARFLMESAEFSKSGPQILQAICEALEWDVGVFWMRDRVANVLRCVEVWHAPAVDVDAFAAASRALTFASGVGLPGRVWDSGTPVWIPVVPQDADFLRAPLRHPEAGCVAGSAFPSTTASSFWG